MAETKERRKNPRKAATVTPKPDSKGGAPRRSTSEQHSRMDVSSEEARRQIAEAAYYRAKERGFEPGHELEDWIEAESEVMGRLSERP
jgi:hypothetical protein